MYLVRTKGSAAQGRLFSEEIRRNTHNGRLLCICSVAAVLLIFIISHFTYTLSAKKYCKLQAYDTMTEVSSQLSSSISANIRSWYDQLHFVSRLASDMGNDTESVFACLDKANFSEFDKVGAIMTDGTLLFPDRRPLSFLDEPFFQKFLSDEGLQNYAGTAALDESAGRFIVFAVPLAGAEQPLGESGGIDATGHTEAHPSGIFGAISEKHFSEILETEAFGKNYTYVVISDADGNVIADTEAQKVFGENLLDTFATFAPPEILGQLREDLKQGQHNTLDLMGVTKEFLTYYTPVLSPESGSAIQNRSSSKTADGADSTPDNGTSASDSGNAFSAGNWRLLILTRADILTQNVSSLFDESRIVLYVILLIFMVSLIVLAVLTSQKKNTELRLRYLDPLTQVLNDDRFRIDANLLLARNPEHYAVVSYNILQFKLINTRLGHESGDRILRIVGQTIQSFLGPDELVSHSYADRFSVLMRLNPDTHLQKIRDLEQLLENTGYPSDSKLKFTIGVYRLRPEDYDISVAIDRARFAQTKTREGYQVLSNMVIYSDEMFQKQAQESALAEMADQALMEQHFLVYYQLKRNIQEDSWMGSEALVRWKDPDLGFIYPNRFIPVFEQNGFVVKLDEYVFRKVCQDLAASIRKGEKTVPVSVNLSKCHLEHPDFMDKYETILNSFDIPHELIEFEITESMVVKDVLLMKKVISKIHSMGCKCSLDDFGTGYSSFNMLKEFDFDTIKLDRSFFYGTKGFDADSQIIVSSLIELSHKLGKTVISEGIESSQQAEFLAVKNCDAIQGYFYARPVPLTQYQELLASIQG